MKSEKKTSFNYFRKAWHMLGLILPVCYYLDIFQGAYGLVYATRAVLVLILLFCLALLVLLEFSRFKIGFVQSLFVKIAGPLLKEEEKYRINGTFPYFLSITFVVLFFPPDIAILSLLFLVIGDPMAAWVGTHYGKNRFSNGKSKEGIVAFLVSSALVGIWFVYLVQGDSRTFGIYHFGSGSFWENLILILPAVVAAAVTELYSGTYWNGVVDDNLLIPVVSAVVLGSLAIWILGLEPSQIFLDPTLLFAKY
ncbi:diacylglycerol/polyprenol kinase family protein [Leptospira wolffii]|uniref:Diacylglycerol/polyprenol kinase family protein n=1 Tax=Leptospira wolffii TaxID=409998 RepID=A0ABV5BLT9_9LEPT|nr:phosphatidate cytidylyltransferase [Leptospira wolffii]EPG66798.1 putative phosphatidate cytidylyltransferase [Leptospira wolffii serovar Khorat str. Khorat-H2]